MLRVDEGCHTAALLRLGDDVQREGGLARGLGTVDLDDPAPWDTADTECDVERERAGRNDVDGLSLHLAETHDRSLPVGSLDLAERRLQCPIPLRRHRLTPLVMGRPRTPAAHFNDGLDATTCCHCACQRCTPKGGGKNWRYGRESRRGAATGGGPGSSGGANICTVQRSRRTWQARSFDLRNRAITGRRSGWWLELVAAVLPSTARSTNSRHSRSAAWTALARFASRPRSLSSRITRPDRPSGDRDEHKPRRLPLAGIRTGDPGDANADLALESLGGTHGHRHGDLRAHRAVRRRADAGPTPRCSALSRPRTR